MKIISIQNYNEQEHTFKINSVNACLNQPIDSEQVKKEKLSFYINNSYHYVIGREEFEFVFLNVLSVPLYVSDDKDPEYVYQVDLLVSEKVYRVQLSKKEYSDEKWLGELGTREVLIIPRNKYQRIIKEVKPQNANGIFFKTIGIHKVNDQYFYVGSDCAISKIGRCDDVLALQEGFNLSYDENMNNEEVAEKVVRYNSMNFRIFYPFHCLAVMSVLAYFLNEMGKRAGMILWVDGEVSSGKTELAITLGNFFACGDRRSDMIKHLHTTKMKLKDIEMELTRYQGGIFVLDDVKKEESVGNKEKLKTITDMIVRTVYIEKANDNVNEMAIITGEYFKEQMSTISRLVYLNIGNFLQDDENSKSFEYIQGDKDYFNHFMCSFIAWLLKKMDNETYMAELKERLGESRDDAKEEIYDVEKKLRPRMIESCSLLLFATRIIRDYLCDILDEKDRKRSQMFYEEGKEAVVRIVLETWIKSLDYQPIFDMAFNNIKRKIKIKDCRYGENYLNANSRDVSYVFAQIRENDGKSYTERVSRKEKMWLLKLDQECAGILINQGKEDILLINKETICTEIREEIRAQKDNWHIVYYESDYTDEKILAGLLNAHRLLAHKRSDNAFDKIINYPMIEYDDESGEIGISDKRKVQMVRVYLDDEKKLLKDFELKKEELEKWCKVRQKLRDNRGGSVEIAELDSMLRYLNKFSDLK